MHIGNAAPATGTGPVATPNAIEAERTKARALVAEFESMLIAQMLRGMKEAMAPESDQGGFGHALLGDTVTTELSGALSRAGGLGLSELLSTAIARLDASGYAPRGTSVHAPIEIPLMPTPAGHDEGVEGNHVHGHAHEPGFLAAHTVTSAYGWRSDPIQGAQRFHAGTDVRAAYGQPILAATEGVVTFAGERPGYGLIVTVDHGNGLETRYAHLSAASVKAGTRVGAGDVIAQAGASGRATGPHLHFEVRQDGTPVDPARVTGLGPVVG